MTQQNGPLLWFGFLASPLIWAGVNFLYPLRSVALSAKSGQLLAEDNASHLPALDHDASNQLNQDSASSLRPLNTAPSFLNAQETPIPSRSEEESENPFADPELGVLRLIEVPVESVEILDPELGILRLQELPLTTEEPSPSVYLQLYSNFFWTDNVSSVVDDSIDDGIFQIGASLSAFPALGSRTYLLSSVGGNLVRYTNETELDYNDISFDLGVYHAFTRRAYLELGWNNDQFFDRGSGDRFLNDHSFYVTVGRRDRLSPRLRLDSEYELEYNLSDPVNRNRAINQISTSLNYQVSQRLETELSYRFTLVDFTKQDRNDSYHQLIAELSYDLSPESRLSLFGGGRLGDSSESFLNFNSALVGISISVNLPLF